MPPYAPNSTDCARTAEAPRALRRPEAGSALCSHTGSLGNACVIYSIVLYQKLLSPILGSNCRFTPTCSSYALQAFRTYPFWKATLLAGKRILKCHPFHPGGYDPL